MEVGVEIAVAYSIYIGKRACVHFTQRNLILFTVMIVVKGILVEYHIIELASVFPCSSEIVCCVHQESIFTRASPYLNSDINGPMRVKT
jgi:hypothetical protein